MPWTTNDYPAAMKNLDDPVREKSIDIANALVEDGYDKGRAIPIAIAQAKKWADNQSDDDRNLHVVPHPEGWAVSREKSRRASFIMSSKEEARNRAIEIAKGEGVDVVIHDDDGRITNYVDLIEEEGAG